MSEEGNPGEVKDPYGVLVVSVLRCPDKFLV